MPRFEVTTLDGRRVRYADVWQHRNLVLITIPSGQAAQAGERMGDWRNAAAAVQGPDNEWIVTSGEVEGVARPGVLVADQWGEIHFVTEAATSADLPSGEELLEWLEYVQHQCPECQGEAL